jgi:hypothetical protein
MDTTNDDLAWPAGTVYVSEMLDTPAEYPSDQNIEVVAGLQSGYRERSWTSAQKNRHATTDIGSVRRPVIRPWLDLYEHR